MPTQIGCDQSDNYPNKDGKTLSSRNSQNHEESHDGRSKNLDKSSDNNSTATMSLAGSLSLGNYTFRHRILKNVTDKIYDLSQLVLVIYVNNHCLA